MNKAEFHIIVIVPDKSNQVSCKVVGRALFFSFIFFVEIFCLNESTFFLARV